MTRYLLVFVIVVCIHDLVSAQQNLLMLQKRSRHKNVYYKEGDVISFRIKDKKGKITSEIIYLSDSTIVFEGFTLAVNKISHLYIDEKTRWWLRFKVAQLALIGGGGYMLLDLINTGELNKNTLVVGGAIVGVGILAQVLIGNKIKIKGRTRLRIMHFRSP